MAGKVFPWTFLVKPYNAEGFDVARHAEVAKLYAADPQQGGQRVIAGEAELVSVVLRPDGMTAVTFNVPIAG